MGKSAIMELVDKKPVLTAWKIDVEETQQFEESGLVVAVNRLGKRIHFKKGKQTEWGIELVPLNLDELKALNIEESLNESYFDLDIEESAEEPEGELKHKVNMQDANSIKEGKVILDKRLKELEGSTTEENQAEIKRLLEENEDLSGKLDLIAQQTFEKKKRELGAPKEIDTPEKLEGFARAKGEYNPASGGTANLNDAQYGKGLDDDIFTKQYDNPVDLVRDLRIQAQNGNEKAKMALDVLFLKGLKSGQPIVGKSESILLKDLIKKRKRN